MTYCEDPGFSLIWGILDFKGESVFDDLLSCLLQRHKSRKTEEKWSNDFVQYKKFPVMQGFKALE